MKIFTGESKTSAIIFINNFRLHSHIMATESLITWAINRLTQEVLLGGTNILGHSLIFIL